MKNKIRQIEELNKAEKTKLFSYQKGIKKLEKEIQENRIDADSGAFLIIQARRRVGQLLTATA